LGEVLATAAQPGSLLLVGQHRATYRADARLDLTELEGVTIVLEEGR